MKDWDMFGLGIGLILLPIILPNDGIQLLGAIIILLVALKLAFKQTKENKHETSNY